MPIGTFPHCDSRILHAPGECAYCDSQPEWQELRQAWGIAFTGRQPDGAWISLPCAADAARPARAGNDHRRWGGNKPTSAAGDPSWPAETAASRALYGDKGGRQPWPLLERLRTRAARPVADWRKRRRGWRKENGWWRYP
jgi:hypothetical protein